MQPLPHSRRLSLKGGISPSSNERTLRPAYGGLCFSFLYFVRLREIGLPLNAENNLPALFNLFTVLHRGKALTTEEKKTHFLSTDLICDDKFSGPNIITSFMTNFSRSSSAKDTQLWFQTTFTSETTCNCGTKQINRELTVCISIVQDQKLNLNREAIESAFMNKTTTCTTCLQKMAVTHLVESCP
jgi:hypothetical protein